MRFLKIFRGDGAKPVAEAELLAAYRGSGDAALVGALYQPYMEMVFAICYKYLKDEADSKDAVMQIFEKLLVDLRTHEVAYFKTWLHTVTRNFCLMQLRAKRTFVNAGDVNSADPDLLLLTQQTDEQWVMEGNLNALEHCMETLVPVQRTAIDLFYLKEKCYREIAEETGFDANKVKSYIQNGKRNLKICMEKNGR